MEKEKFVYTKLMFIIFIQFFAIVAAVLVHPMLGIMIGYVGTWMLIVYIIKDIEAHPTK